MTVRSADPNNAREMAAARQIPSSNGTPPESPRGPDWATGLGNLALWLLVLSAGLIFFGVNGGYSVLGLGRIAGAFNEAGAIAWAVLNSWTFTVPLSPDVVEASALSASQPVLPWVFVVSASLLQIACFALTLSKRRVPPVLAVATAVMSAYDLGSTFVGFGEVKWIAEAGTIVQGLLAVFFTFGLEAVLSLLLRRKRR